MYIIYIIVLVYIHYLTIAYSLAYFSDDLWILLSTGHWLYIIDLTTDHWPPTTDHYPLTSANWPPFTDHLPLINIYRLQTTANWPLSTHNCSLTTINFPLTIDYTLSHLTICSVIDGALRRIVVSQPLLSYHSVVVIGHCLYHHHPYFIHSLESQTSYTMTLYTMT